VRSRKASPPRQQTPTPDRYTEIQQALAAKGYYKGEANGVWGPDSVSALKRFQAEQNLQADGKIGALSLIALGLGPKHESTGEIAAKPTAKPPEKP
jgi:peptidoglycan hydrolase-like protein with peptidoglycan-binding domain